MAISIRGGTPGVSTVSVTNPVTLTLSGTRQPQSGDLLVIIHSNNFYTAATMPVPSVNGSTTGVTAISGGSVDGGTNKSHVKSYTYDVTSTGDITISATHTGVADEEKSLVAYVLVGANNANPIDAASSTFDNVGGTSQALPAISPANADSFLIVNDSSGAGTEGISYTSPASPFVEQYDVRLTGLYSHVGGTEQLAASGSTGTRTFTASSSCQWGGVILAINTGTAAVATGDPRLYTPQPPGLWSPAGRFRSAIAVFDSGVTDVAVSAESAEGVGAALDAFVDIDVFPAEAAGTGTAPDPVASVGALAECATGTGQAIDPYVSTVGVATGTGAALDAVVAVQVFPAEAAGTGQALDATVSTATATNAPAEVATGTGTALDPYIAAVEVATGSGAALDPTASIGALAELVTGTGAALDPLAAVQVFPSEAAGTGAALDATVSTVPTTDAPAGLASGTGAALDPYVSAVEVATGTGVANNATVSSVINAPAGLAVGVGQAIDPYVSAVEVAAGTGAALDPTIQIFVPAGSADATGQALVVSANLTVLAGLASGIGEAPDVTSPAAIIRNLIVDYGQLELRWQFIAWPSTPGWISDVVEVKWRGGGPGGRWRTEEFETRWRTGSAET